MFLILVLMALTPPVCGVTQLLAAEGANVTLQWDSGIGSIRPSTLILYCFLRTSPERMILEVAGGKQLPVSWPQFSGRVQWDREALELGQVRVTLTHVSAQDQGLYWCYIFANYHPVSKHWEHRSEEYFKLTVTRDGRDPQDKPGHDKHGNSRRVTFDLSPGKTIVLCLVFGLMIVMATSIAITAAVMKIKQC